MCVCDRGQIMNKNDYLQLDQTKYKRIAQIIMATAIQGQVELLNYNNFIDMTELPILIFQLEDVILFVCPPSPKLKPLDSPRHYDQNFTLEPKSNTHKKNPKKHARLHKTPKSKIKQYFL